LSNDEKNSKNNEQVYIYYSDSSDHLLSVVNQSNDGIVRNLNDEFNKSTMDKTEDNESLISLKPIKNHRGPYRKYSIEDK
jgi:chlorite dismutase